MIYKRGWQRTISQYELQKILERQGVQDAEKVSLIICGHYDSGWHEFTLVDNTWQSSEETTAMQRINRLWFVPLYLLTIPFQWLFRGGVGVRNESKLGALMARLTGLE